ncbi:MAG: response regulator [Pseudomonadales bacterium]|nr:response regulator [Pseudomonadales bacterium]MBH2032302.1 response regulator [Pseudomonadales bacterium]MBH2078027.1 response regulator [Pseudomonadales bacterium]
MNKKNLRILVVEDHPFQLRAIQCLLESYGFSQITLTDSAAGAMQKMLEVSHPFDILLCDQCLPDLSGLDLIKMASDLNLISHAILLSSLTPIELDELAKEANTLKIPLLGCLQKPLKQLELRNLLTFAYL